MLIYSLLVLFLQCYVYVDVHNSDELLFLCCLCHCDYWSGSSSSSSSSSSNGTSSRISAPYDAHIGQNM
jgi:hypothetical protein